MVWVTLWVVSGSNWRLRLGIPLALGQVRVRDTVSIGLGLISVGVRLGSGLG